MPRKPYTHHYIYKTTCKITNKYYIGMHSTSDLEDDYIGSGKYLWNSIRKHGRENHEREILEWFPDRNSLKAREKELVNESLLQDPMCMNLKLGGEGGGGSTTWSIETRKKISKRGLERRIEVQKSPQYKEKMSESLKKAVKEGRNKIYEVWKGRKHSDITRQNFSESRKGTGIGSKNSQYGTFWITNDLENKKIKNTDSIPENWRRGRKNKK